MNAFLDWAVTGWLVIMMLLFCGLAIWLVIEVVEELWGPR
jgi:hypothetical protein